jgi:hypothetical protein
VEEIRDVCEVARLCAVMVDSRSSRWMHFSWQAAPVHQRLKTMQKEL